MAPTRTAGKPVSSNPSQAKPPDIAAASVPATLAALHVNPAVGLAQADVDVRRREHGYNEVAGESKDAEKAPGDVLSSGSVIRRGEGNGVVMLMQREGR
jgi:hypothetical protein